MVEFVKETLLLLPFLFVTYLVLEGVEAHANGALERFLGRARSFGPIVGALAGAVPQCGVSASAASFFAGGVVGVGTLLAVMLSTSDELLPVLLASQVPPALLLKILGIKILSAAVIGFIANLIFAKKPQQIETLCEHSHCGCVSAKGIIIPALIHTAEIFVFIVLISGAIEIAVHYCDFASWKLNTFLAALLGLIPNCAVSVAAAKLYLAGNMSGAALMASSFSGSGLGLLVLFRTNRNWRENLLILIAVYGLSVVLGYLTGGLL